MAVSQRVTTIGPLGSDSGSLILPSNGSPFNLYLMVLQPQNQPPTDPVLFLTRYWVIFQGQQNETSSHAAEACRRFLISDNLEPKLFPLPNSVNSRANLVNYRALWEAEGLLPRKIWCWSPSPTPYHEWPSPRALRSQPAPAELPHTNLLPSLRKVWPNPRWGDKFKPCFLAPCQLTLQQAFLFSEAGAIALTSMCFSSESTAWPVWITTNNHCLGPVILRVTNRWFPDSVLSIQK